MLLFHVRIDDVFKICDHSDNIYLIELKLRDTTDTSRSASHIDL